MRLIHIVWDHTETDLSRSGYLREQLRRFSQEPWEKDIRGCHVCAAENARLGYISEEVRCNCWRSEGEDDHFVLWHHSSKAQDLGKWRGHARLLAVIRLTVAGSFTRNSPPSEEGEVFPFLCLDLREAFRRIKDDDLQNALYVLGQAFEALGGATQSGPGHLVETFLSSSGILGNRMAANLCNATSPSPFLTFIWSLFMRNGGTPPISGQRAWGEITPRVLDVPSDLLTELEQLNHRGRISQKDIATLQQSVAKWFVNNSYNAREHQIDDKLWSSERERVTEKILSMIRA